MLFSSGDSPKNTSSILSGERLDEVQPGESPFVFSAAFDAPTSLTPSTANTVESPIILVHPMGAGSAFAFLHTLRPSPQPGFRG